MRVGTRLLGIFVTLMASAGPSGAADSLVIQTWSGTWETGARAVGDAFAKKYNVDVRYELQQNTRLGIANDLDEEEGGES